MRIGSFIYPELANNVDMTNLVPSTSMFAVRAEQPTSEPYIVYREISSVPTNTTGDSTSTSADPRTKQRSILDITTVQVSCFAATYLSVENIAVQVRSVLDRKWGAPSSAYSGDILIDSCVYDSCVDDYDDKYGDRGIYIKHLDFTLRVTRLTN